MDRKDRSEYQRIYRATHAKEIRENKRAYRAAHPEEGREYRRSYRAAHKEERREHNRRYAAAHPEELRERKRAYRVAHAEEIREKRKKLYNENREESLKKSQEWSAKHPEKNREKARRWASENLKKSNKWRAENPSYTRDREIRDPEFKTANRLRQRLFKALRGKTKSASTLKLLGCTIPELRAHIESQFRDGMTWENYGRTGWHVDHVIPCAAFDLTDPAQQRACFHYSNLQPLWAVDNLRKGARMPGLERMTG